MSTLPNKRAAPPAQALELLREQSLASLAQHELERRILSGELAAGAKLNEVDVAGALGISRGPVREAFSALSRAGLLRVEKNRGVFVREVSLEEATEFYEVRAALEGLIGQLAARRIAIDEVEQLRALVKRMQVMGAPRTGPAARPAPRGGSSKVAEPHSLEQKQRRADDYFALNVEFHDLLARSARNNALLANYRGVVNQLDLYRRATLQRGDDHVPQSTAEHEAIVEAVAARDEQRAQALLTQHVLGSRERAHALLARPT